MISLFSQWINKKYPQNYIIKKPHIGTVILLVFCFCFLVLYKPLNVHNARSFSLEFTMAVYCLSLIVPVFGIAKTLKHTPYFSDVLEWTIFKEIVSIVLILLGMGVTIYFMGFLVEGPAGRWNINTFISSCIMSAMIGIIPLGYFTVINYRYLFVTDITQTFNPVNNSLTPVSEKRIIIASQLKKEEVSFYPSELIYAESDGNYVVFHLEADGRPDKKIVRNSINSVSQQLSTIPFLIRTHRAFIVNMKKIRSRKGNTLGYRLKLSGTETEIPVSRQNTRDFDELIRQYT